MSRVTRPPEVHYPDSDGRPMAETPHHRQVMTDTIQVLEAWFADDLWVYVSGNMLLYYVRGNPRRHVAPDVFVTKGIRKQPTPARRLYLVWEEGKGPDAAIEITSKSTRKEDQQDKFALYQDVLKVSEYFLFDPYGEYLQPALQGYRLRKGRYVRIRPVKGRLPSKVLGLHLEAVGEQLRFYNPATGAWLLTPLEQAEAEKAARARAEAAQAQAEQDRQREAAARQQAEAAQAQAEAAQARAEQEQQREAGARQQAEAEVARLRRELDALRRRPSGPQ